MFSDVTSYFVLSIDLLWFNLLNTCLSTVAGGVLFTVDIIQGH
jgi:hypothetical protein